MKNIFIYLKLVCCREAPDGATERAVATAAVAVAGPEAAQVTTSRDSGKPWERRLNPRI